MQERVALDPAQVDALRCLLSSVEEQQARLGAEVAAVLAVLGGSARFGQPSLPAEADHSSVAEVSPTLVRCLGALEVQAGGVAIESWRSGKARAVFEYLVNHRKRPVPRDTLIQALWPDPEALASGTSLKVAVHALRQIFSGAGEAGRRPGMSVVVQESSYQIVAPGLWLDVEEFERCCSLGVQLEARGQRQESLAVYQRAAEVYRGDFLPDSWDEWAIFRREALKDQYLFVLAKLADACLQAADYHACIRVCRQLLEQDCCREDTFRMLMVCHANLGQRGRARRWYELCEFTLRSALNLEPEPETVRVFQWACGSADQGTRRASSAVQPPMRLTAL